MNSPSNFSGVLSRLPRNVTEKHKLDRVQRYTTYRVILNLSIKASETIKLYGGESLLEPNSMFLVGITWQDWA